MEGRVPNEDVRRWKIDTHREGSGRHQAAGLARQELGPQSRSVGGGLTDPSPFLALARKHAPWLEQPLALCAIACTFSCFLAIHLTTARILRGPSALAHSLREPLSP